MRGRRKKHAISSDLWLPTLAVSLFGGFAPPAARQTAAVFFRLLAVAPMNEHHVTAAWFGSVSVERNALLIAAWQGSEMWVPSAIERWHSQQSDLPVLIRALRAVLFDRYHQLKFFVIEKLEPTVDKNRVLLSLISVLSRISTLPEAEFSNSIGEFEA